MKQEKKKVNIRCNINYLIRFLKYKLITPNTGRNKIKENNLI